MLTDATVDVARNGVQLPGMRNVSIKIKPATPMNLDFSGVQQTTDIVSPAIVNGVTASWNINDDMVIAGNSSYQVKSYRVLSAIPPAPNARPRLALWRIRLMGAVR